MISSEEKLLAVLCHASFFLFPILVPLVIFLLKKDSFFVRHHAKEALIFHLAITIASFLCGLLMIILIGFILIAILLIFSIIVTIIAIVKSINGEFYRYPITSTWAQKL